MNPTIKKIGKGAVIALLTALATYLESAIPGADFGKNTALVVAGNSILINAVREYLKANGYSV